MWCVSVMKCVMCCNVMWNVWKFLCAIVCYWHTHTHNTKKCYMNTHVPLSSILYLSQKLAPQGIKPVPDIFSWLNKKSPREKKKRLQRKKTVGNHFGRHSTFVLVRIHWERSIYWSSSQFLLCTLIYLLNVWINGESHVLHLWWYCHKWSCGGVVLFTLWSG